jgi:hypothetical protein
MAISIIAIGVIVARLIWPNIKLDSITLGLLIVAILPWFSALIESAKFPGGWEVKFRDVKSAGDRVVASSPPSTQAVALPKPSFLSIAETDPNLALVGLRIEIETRVRKLAERADLPIEGIPLTRLVDELGRRGVIDKNAQGGLRELIFAGNQAAHGATVERSAADWAIDVGPQILQALDEKLTGP